MSTPPKRLPQLVEIVDQLRAEHKDSLSAQELIKQLTLREAQQGRKVGPELARRAVEESLNNPKQEDKTSFYVRSVVFGFVCIVIAVPLARVLVRVLEAAAGRLL